jgi:hypothetical protein
LQFANLAKAQDEYDDQSSDPPTRVARLNYSKGSISFRPAGEDDWVDGVPNRPMVTGDDLWADQDSRAEVHVGSAAIRLGQMTGITFLTLDDNNTQIRMAQGTMILHVRHVDDDDTFEIDTPNVAFTVLAPGEYRFEVSQDGGQTIVSAFHGRGRVTGGGYTYNVVAGQQATFTGGDQLQYDLAQLPGGDDFDQWAFDRDAREDRADEANYVSREMTGYEDLDDSGDWSYVAGYGECWRPRVDAGWAPYRFGHWVWVGPWGWTWVEDEPWGFAPFHYGRWANVNNGWFWVPGPVVVRPIYAPALVAFVGGGAGFRFSAGVGVGWFPLGPGEVYVPSYHVSRTYVNNVNITNTRVNVVQVTNVYNTVIVNKTVINNVYVNQKSNAVTVVSHDAFVNARPVAQNVMKVDAREVAAAPVSHVVAAEPARASVVGAGRPSTVKPPSSVVSRPVVAVRTPAPPPQSIAQKQAAVGGHLNQQALVRPVAPARPAPAQPAAQPGRPAQSAQPPSQQGFKPFGQPNANAPANNNPQVRQMPQTQPRTMEQPEPARPSTPQYRNLPPQQTNRDVPPPAQNRPAQPENQNRDFRSPQQQERPAQPAPQEQHPLVKPTPPVQERNQEQEKQQEQKFNQWQQQRPTPPPPAAKPAPAPKPAPPPEPKKK